MRNNSRHNSVTASVDLDSRHEGRSHHARRQSSAVTSTPPHFEPGRRRSLIPSLESSVSYFLSSHQKSARIHGLTDGEWQSLQDAISGIFREEKVEPTEVYELHKMIQTVLKSELSTFLGEYYKTHLLKRGMQYLLEEILREGDGDVLLHALAELWVKFYSTMLPQIQAILISVQTTNLTIRQMSLVGFRDTVLLDVNVIDALISAGSNIEAEITQMLLVLQHVHDSRPPSRNYLRLEELVARAISPYIGTRGLYIGGKIKIQRKISSVSRPNQEDLNTPHNGVVPRSFYRSVSHDEYINNNNNENKKDGGHRVIFSIADESEDDGSDQEKDGGDSVGKGGSLPSDGPPGNEEELSDQTKDVGSSLGRDGGNRPLPKFRRGSMPNVLLTSLNSEDGHRKDGGGSACSDSDEPDSPSTLSPLPLRKRSTSECPAFFNRNARRASLPVATSRSILKPPSATVETKTRKNRLRSLFSHKKTKSVHYA